MLLYNLAVMKNSKMKMFTQDESREKQRSPAKTTLIAPELAQKGSRRGTAPNMTEKEMNNLIKDVFLKNYSLVI